MAYSKSQKRIVAAEYARAGTIAGAVERLRNEYETFRDFGESTLRRWRDKSWFESLVQEQAEIQRKADIEAAVQVERSRAVSELQESYISRMARDEALLEATAERLGEILSDPEKVKPSLAVNLFGKLQVLIEKRHQNMLPYISNEPDAQLFATIVCELATREFGAKRGGEFIRTIREEYGERLKEKELAANA